jgi:alpha-galactosidase
MTSNDQAPGVLRLDGPETSMIFAWNDGVPAILHHGRKLAAETDLSALAAALARPEAQATLDVSETLSLHPEASRGFPGHPALTGRRPDEPKTWAGRFSWVEVEQLPAGVVFRLADEPRRLKLELECRMDPETDVAAFEARLSNHGGTPFVVDWLAPPVIVPDRRYGEVLSFHGRWCAEFMTERLPVPVGAMLRENRRGRTSHDSFPGIILLTAETGEEQGACLGCHLGWSGNHRLLLEHLPNGDRQLQMGALFFGEEGRIEPGETMATPPLYVAWSEHGLNALSQKFHAHVRKRLLRLPDPRIPRPVTVNTWEAIYFDHRHERLTALADAAAMIGAERFVLDDGWFRGRRDDTSSLGDWYPDEETYPEGLGPIADYVHDKGMQFGLWVEPEMVSPNSDLYLRHPDWALSVDPYPMITGRNQLVLDICRDDVSDYLYQRLSTLIADHGVDYLKWDMNRDLTSPGGEDGAAAASQQVYALYGLIDRLLKAFPSLEIESCASGGGRIDYGILERAHRFWVSDSNDAVERLRIQQGFSHFFPPEVMGAHVGPAWSHTSGRGLSIGFRALVASPGHLGVEDDLTKMGEADLQVLSDAIERHKADRDIWHHGRFFRLQTADPALIGVMAVSVDRTKARLVVATVDRPEASLPPRLRLPGLIGEQDYRIRLQYASETVDRANRCFDNPLWTEGVTLSGDSLAAIGLSLPILYAQSGLAVAVDAAHA